MEVPLHSTHSSQYVVYQPKPVRVDEARPPVLDHEWKVEGGVKPKAKPKPRPLPPTPVFHLEYKPRAEWEKEFSRAIARYGNGPAPFGYTGKPVFTRPEPPSKPLPQPPASDSRVTQTTPKQESDVATPGESIEEDPEDKRGWWNLTDYLLGCEVGSSGHSDMTASSLC